ncbi:MAG: LON peptidase substrate-binding domain-containing protein [Verrucomicrobiales bacterium]|jgi:Lon protease-like protein|nr:LON peptidase substrate-binding domain-containing protein [Verrucomicrobiales bacterium]
MKLPEKIAVMPLGQVVFFPHMLLPLHIFEPRYRQMLEHALTGNRMFAVSGSDANGHPLPVGTVGLIRACIKKADGTSDLLLQGMRRVHFKNFSAHLPYLTATPKPLLQHSPSNHQAARQLANQIIQIVNCSCTCHHLPHELLECAGGFPDYDSLIDIFAGNLIHCPEQKQQLLECEDTQQRLSLLAHSLRSEYINH